MKTRTIALSVAATLLFLLAVGAGAQTTNLAVVYRLGAGSKLQTGCFPPCLCPSLPPTGFPKGTFRLVFTGADPQFKNYAVQDVNWFVDLSGSMVRITGSGKYRITNTPIPPAHQLELDLAIGSNQLQHFDSGLVPVAGAGFPAIQIKVSINGGQCQDTIIDVGAAPVPAAQMVSYNLVKPTTFAAGCFPPCCLPPATQPVVGGCTLIHLPNYANTTTRGTQDFALISANWTVLSPTVPAGGTFKGFGIYRRRIGPTATPANTWNHRLLMDLRPGNALATTRFDSGWRPLGSNAPTVSVLPNIDIPISANEFACQDQRFDVHARPGLP